MKQWVLSACAVVVAAIVAALWSYRAPTPAPEQVEAEDHRLTLRRLPDFNFSEMFPDPCPLSAIEYKFENFKANILVERFDESSTERKVVFARRRIQVNTDGAANSYHSTTIKADDEQVGAVNLICNATVKIFKTNGADRREVDCRTADTLSVTPEYAAAYEELKTKNWEDTESGHSIRFNWQILGRAGPVRPNGPDAPCVKPDGFFVTKTRLRTSRPRNDCDSRVYPDSNATGTFVLPINWFNSYRKSKDDEPDKFANFHSGDVVVAYRPGNQAHPPVWVYGVIGDAGPFKKLGEASIAFNRQLMRDAAPVNTYRRVLRLDTQGIRGGESREIGFVVFEGSASALKGNYSPDNIRKVGEARFAAWSNGGLEQARARFLACSKKLELMPLASS